VFNERFNIIFVPAALLIFAVSQARAAFIVNVVQDGSNVVATGSGSLDLNGLTYNIYAPGGISYPGELSPNPSDIDPVGAHLGPVAPSAEYDGTISGPSSFGPGNFNVSDPNYDSGGTDATSSSGDPVDLLFNTHSIIVSSTYVSGTQLSDITTFGNETFASMGLTPGTYVYHWGLTNADDYDTLTINIGSASMPEPTSLATLGISASALLLRRRRRMA